MIEIAQKIMAKPDHVVRVEGIADHYFKWCGDIGYILRVEHKVYSFLFGDRCDIYAVHRKEF